MIPRSWFTNPLMAGSIAAAIACLFLYIQNRIDKNAELPISHYAKPAACIGALVAFIVYMGTESKEELLKEPFE